MSKLLKTGRTSQSVFVGGPPTAGIVAFVSRSSKSAFPVQDDRGEDLWESQTLARLWQGQIPREMEGGDSVLHDLPRPKCQESFEDQGRARALEAAGACGPGLRLLKRGGEQEISGKIRTGTVRVFKKISVSTVGEK